MDLFDQDNQQQPLAAQCRPKCLNDMVGHQTLIGESGTLRRLFESEVDQSFILWGPPGVGKTTLARLLADQCRAHWIEISAVMAGINEIRSAVEQAKISQQQGFRTVLFIDEIHRFNKSQQDAFLPHIEEGLITLVGATTENPAFELNRAVLSRVQIFKLEKLSTDDLSHLIERTLDDRAIELGSDQSLIIQGLADYADGDARRALNAIEQLCNDGHKKQIRLEDLSRLGSRPLAFDRNGDQFYELISALHKSIRGSSPDAALYWLCRMLEGGCDPLYIARRLVRIASEDIGNADPRALTICLDAWQAQHQLGSPEGELSLAQAASYLACAPKSNAVYKAYKHIRQMVKNDISREVPLHLRNAPTKVQQQQGYGEDYRYAHDYDEAYVAGECYLPEGLATHRFYQPTDRGLEARIQDKLKRLHEKDKLSHWQRYPSVAASDSVGEVDL